MSDVEPEPVFLATIEQVIVPVPPPVHDTEEIETCAVLVNEPNSPNTNPAMATAAMRVMAMRMTVARIGEMALLLLYFLMFILEPNFPVHAY